MITGAVITLDVNRTSHTIFFFFKAKKKLYPRLTLELVTKAKFFFKLLA